MARQGLMSTHNPPAAIHKSVVVRCDRATAFRLWTERLDLWWPKGHSRSGDPRTQVLLERHLGGRLYERTPEGIEHEWGQVVGWEPPHYLAYHWYLGSGPAQPSHVEIHFHAEAPRYTRVEVLHRGPALIGERWPHASAIFERAWAHVLAAYAAALPPEQLHR